MADAPWHARSKLLSDKYMSQGYSPVSKFGLLSNLHEKGIIYSISSKCAFLFIKWINNRSNGLETDGSNND